jgi:alcohol dehydrogenase
MPDKAVSPALRTTLVEGDYGIPEPVAYVLTRVQRVNYGIDVQKRLADECDRLAIEHGLLVTTSSLKSSELLENIQHQLGSRLAGTFAETKQHVPVQSLDHLIESAQHKEIDGVISVGGGSAIDSAKALVGSLAVGVSTGQELLEYRINYEYPDKVEQRPYTGHFLPHIALSTTLSAAEYDGIFGYTYGGTKFLSAGEDLVPLSIFLDPLLTEQTPNWLLASTGMRAVDHCIETYLARIPTAPTDAACIHALKMLVVNLPKVVASEVDLVARLQCQLSGWLSMSGVSNVTLGLSHGIGHQLGGRSNVPHGITSCVMLPVVLDHLVAESPQMHARLRAVAEAMTGTATDDPSAAPAAVRSLIDVLGLPKRLRDVGVQKQDFREIAEASMGDLVVGYAPVKVSRADIVALLEAAY